VINVGRRNVRQKDEQVIGLMITVAGRQAGRRYVR